MPSNARDLAASVARSLANAGSSRVVSASTAATCMAVGNTSLLDWLLLTSSLGCTSRASPRSPPSSSLARLAITSFRFMLVCVPEPVCQTTSGNSSGCRPSSTSSAAATIAPVFRSSSSPSARFTTAEARLTSANARMISRGCCSPEMAKFCSERCVWAPHNLSAGTSMGPKVSRSVRVPLSAVLMGHLSKYRVERRR